MSHTKVHATTKNRRGRGRGQGNQQDRNTNTNINYSTHRGNNFRDEYSDNVAGNRNREEEWKSSNYRGNRGNGGQNKFKNNNFNRGVPKRSHSSSSSNASSRNGNMDKISDEYCLPFQDRNLLSQDSSRLPTHAQNPIFTGELMHRFSSLLPSSELLDPVEPSYSEQARIASSQKNVENNTFASISNNFTHGFKNYSNRKQQNRKDDCGANGFNSEGNRSRNENYNRLKENDPQKSYRMNTSNSIQESAAIMGSQKRIETRFPTDNDNAQSRLPERDQTSFVTNPPMHLEGNGRNPSSGFSKDNRFIVGANLDRNLKNSSADNYKMAQNSSAGGSSRQSQSKVNSNPQAYSFPDNRIHQQRPNPNISNPPINTSNIERRKQILIANGFDIPNVEGTGFNSTSSNKIRNKKETFQPNFSATFTDQIESFDSRYNNSNKKTPGPNAGNVRKPPDNRSTAASLKAREHSPSSNLPTFELPKQIDNYNDFLKQQRRNERELPPQQNSITGRRENSNPLVNMSESNPLINNSLSMTDGAIAGMPHFNIQQSARGPGQRVPSRSEALQKIQDEYEMKLVEYEAKEREREAKKREQYLARYSHVDQGHRLTEAYLEEASGFAPGYTPMYQSEEEVRRRQQDQFMRDAMVFREREMEENERRRKKEEENKKQWLNKNKNINAGYKLGNKDNRGSASGAGKGQKSFPKAGKAATTEKKPLASQQVARSEDLMCPELMLEGETLEEALERQQEQLLLEALLCDDREPRNPDKVEPPRKGRLPPRLVQQKETEKAQKLAQNLAAVDVSNPNTNTGPATPPVSVVKPLPTPATVEPNKGAEATREKLLAQLASLLAKPASTPEVKEPDNIQKPQTPQTETVKPQKPVSCVLNNPSKGAVLVLRPSEEALNQAVHQHLELLDEMDKHGDSPLYKPRVEQAPVYSNNRFEQKASGDTVKVTGAIPKTLAAAAPTEGPAEPEEPVIDHQAEMRAARLRMQQQYEETLRRQREAQENASST